MLVGRSQEKIIASIEAEALIDSKEMQQGVMDSIIPSAMMDSRITPNVGKYDDSSKLNKSE